MISFLIADFLNALDFANISRTSLAFILLSLQNCSCHLTPLLSIFLQEQPHT